MPQGFSAWWGCPLSEPLGGFPLGLACGPRRLQPSDQPPSAHRRHDTCLSRRPELWDQGPVVFAPSPEKRLPDVPVEQVTWCSVQLQSNWSRGPLQTAALTSHSSTVLPVGLSRTPHPTPGVSSSPAAPRALSWRPSAQLHVLGAPAPHWGLRGRLWVGRRNCCWQRACTGQWWLTPLPSVSSAERRARLSKPLPEQRGCWGCPHTLPPCFWD